MFATFMKRIGGLLAMLIGLVGIALSGYTAYHAWRTAELLRRDIPQSVRQFEGLLSNVHRQGMIAVDTVESARERLTGVRATVDELPRSGQPAGTRTLLNSVSSDIIDSLARAEDFVRLMQSNLEGASGALLFLESIPFLGPSLTKGKTGDNDLRRLAASLTEISGTLKQATEILSELRTRRTVDAMQVARLQSALSQIDQHLLQLQSALHEFSLSIDAATKGLDRIERQSDRRIQRAALFVGAMLVCFAFSQLHLFVAGCRLVKK